MSDSLRPHALWPTRGLHPWDFPNKNTGLGSHFLLLGIFTTQGSNLGLLHYRQILYQLSYEGNPYSIYSYYKILAIFPVLYNISL